MLLDDIYAYLVANGYGPNTSWPLCIGFFPDDSDQMIGLFPTGGYPADTMNRENERLTFQVRVRAARLNFAGCYTTWLAIFNLLQDAQQITIDSVVYLPGYTYIQALHYGPMFFNDDRGRSNMTANFRVLRPAEGTT